MTRKSAQKERRRLRSRWTQFLWGLLLAVLIGTGLIFLLIYLTGLPTFEELENPDFELATIVLDRDQKEIGRYYLENRVPIDYEEINPKLIQALIATEDKRYHRHAGIDFPSVGRVAVKTILLQQKSSGGGSTISQQLAKLLFPRRNFNEMNTLQVYFVLGVTKFKEWMTAVKLEKRYTKEEIIAMYLNKFDFLYGAHGIHAASETYFGKDQAELTLAESALLIGMLKNPSLYNPIKFPENARERRNVVLHQMERNELISEEMYNSLKTEPVDVTATFHRKDHISGPAAYFRMELAKHLKNLLQEEHLRKPDGSTFNIYRDGLVVHTTMDLAFQEAAEQGIKSHMGVVQDRFWREWRGTDLWKYTGDDVSLKLKMDNLNYHIRNTDRYQRLYKEYLENKVEDLGGRIGIDVNEDILVIMKEESERKGAVQKYVAEDEITPGEAKAIKSYIQSGDPHNVLETFEEFKVTVDSILNTEYEMVVYDYKSVDEKDTVMTPLDSIKYHRSILQAGVLAIDPDNGAIRAWAGGLNHKYFQYDHITTRRQVGSTFKPFIYAAAISLKGISPCFQVQDIPYSIRKGEGSFNLIKDWSPKNATGSFSGASYRLFDALRLSINSASVYLTKQMGSVDPILGLIHQMGLDTSLTYDNGRHIIPRQPSISLGAADLSPIEMTAAYATFASNGVYHKPFFIDRIEDKHGRVIYSSVRESRQALDFTTNYVMVEMLKQAGGNNPDARKLKSEFGGKTGTTNKHSDGWFIGITPELVVGAWVGGEDRWIRFRSLTYGQGSKMARPLVTNTFQYLEEHPETGYDPSATFPSVDGDLEIETDCSKYRGFQFPGGDDDEDFFDGTDLLDG